MDFKDEKLHILKMVEEGKISSDEGVALLDALNETKVDYTENEKAKWLKIRVSDSNDNAKVNVSLPITLIDASMKIASKVAPNFVPELKESGLDEMDLKEILESIKNGASGKLVDVEGENGEKVEIIVE